MAQPATNPKIEELRFRLKTDPKSRLFYPLAEELRKAGQSEEAEQVLLSGLEFHGTYLSAWVSLGRALREQKKDRQAVDALTKALQLDPGNVVAARLLGDAYLALGEKLEAIKKYKLVHALMPSDEDLEAMITQLDGELNPAAAETPIPVTEPEPEPEPQEEPEPEPEPQREPDPEPEPAPPEPERLEDASPFAAEVPLAFVPPPPPAEEPAFSDNPFGEEEPRAEIETRDVEPMRVAHDTSPFEEPVADYTAAALEVEAPSGFQIDEAPLEAEVPALLGESEESDVFAPSASAEPATDDVTDTITMADLYARQGLKDDARHIYENILARHPENEAVRAKLDALNPPPPAPPPAPEPVPMPIAAASSNGAKAERLQSWLRKMKGTEAGHV